MGYIANYYNIYNKYSIPSGCFGGNSYNSTEAISYNHCKDIEGLSLNNSNNYGYYQCVQTTDLVPKSVSVYWGGMDGTFTATGSSSTYIMSVSAYTKCSTIKPPAITRSGYTLKGWSKSYSDSTPCFYNASGTWVGSSSKAVISSYSLPVLYAVWESNGGGSSGGGTTVTPWWGNIVGWEQHGIFYYPANWTGSCTVYKSKTNRGVPNSAETFIVNFRGLPNFRIGIASWGEVRYDYVAAFELDLMVYTSDASTTTPKMTTKNGGLLTAAPSASYENFATVYYPNDGDTHFVMVAYIKDGSGNGDSDDTNCDRGYVLIPAPSGMM